MTAQELRDKFEIDLFELQSKCPHLESGWMEHHWAPGHVAGLVRVCLNCEKTLERSP